MRIDAWLGALLLVVLLLAARRIYSSGKAGARRWGRSTLVVSIAISALAFPAFQFVIVKSFVGSETGRLFEVTQLLVETAIFLNLFFSAYLLGILPRGPQDGQSTPSTERAGEQVNGPVDS